jgi:hypothetical protein
MSYPRRLRKWYFYKRQMNKPGLFFGLGIACLLAACSGNNGPDVSHIQAEAKVVRFEKLLSACSDTLCIRKLMQEYPAFSEIYFRHILQLRFPENPDSILVSLTELSADSTLAAISAQVASNYGDFSSLQSEINQLYKHLIYYFPDGKKLPVIYSCLSGLSIQSFIFQEADKSQDGIGLGLDLFLHPSVPYKQLMPDNTAFSDYVTRSWNKVHITRKVAETILTDKLGEARGSRLIDQMIHEGKKAYLLKLLLPTAPDTVIMEYSSPQLAWCRENELQMWSFFFDEKLFFESNPVKVAKYVYPAPTSAGMPEESPGRTGAYLGWQIVNAYMERYPDTSLAGLLDMHDGQAFLEKSKYKPAR